MAITLEQRAQIHAALGEPVRLGIVDELRVSDRSPTELARRFGLPSNLLAHHLDVLTGAGLIERFPSSGDRRRRYVRLRRATLREIATVGGRPAGRVMFVCSLNSARSQLAAALWTSRTGRPASSAGTRPATRVHPGAVAAGRRFGLDLTDATPRGMGEPDDGVQIVTVCDQAHEELGADLPTWHWSVPDPVPIGTDDAFDRTIHELDERILDLTDPGAANDD